MPDDAKNVIKSDITEKYSIILSRNNGNRRIITTHDFIHGTHGVWPLSDQEDENIRFDKVVEFMKNAVMD